MKIKLEKIIQKINASPKMTRGKIDKICRRGKLDSGNTEVEFKATENKEVINVYLKDHTISAKSSTEKRYFSTKYNEDFIDAIERHLKENNLYLEAVRYIEEKIKEKKSFLGIKVITKTYPVLRANLYRLKQD